MSEWIKTAKVGDKVVCVEDGWELDALEVSYGVRCPTPDGIYTIREIVADDKGFFLRFTEIANPLINYGPRYGMYEVAFGAEDFRPVQTRPTDISIFTRLLNTTPADLVEA